MQVTGESLLPPRTFTDDVRQQLWCSQRQQMVGSRDNDFPAARDPRGDVLIAIPDHRVLKLSDHEHGRDGDVRQPGVGGRVSKLVLALAEEGRDRSPDLGLRCRVCARCGPRAQAQGDQAVPVPAANSRSNSALYGSSAGHG